MKRIILSSLVILGLVGLITGATIAYFNDTATIYGSTFSASTLDLKIDDNPDSEVQNWVNEFTTPTAYQPDSLKPGDTGEQIIDIKSVGNVGGNVTVDLNRTSAWSDLAGVLVFHVWYDAENNGTWVDTGFYGTVGQFNGPYTLGPIKSSTGIASVKFVWSVPTTAGNEIQGDIVTINTVFGLEQVR